MLDRESILAATEEALRRHGPTKVGVVDVARTLGVSHAAVYRHFASKAALREAVTRQWLSRALPALAHIAFGTLPAPERLRMWLHALYQAKVAAITDDPELFAMYGMLVAEHSAAVADYMADLKRQLVHILSEFNVSDPEATSRSVFDTTTAFHHPAHAAEWSKPGTEDRLGAVCDLVLDALQARHASADRRT